MSEEPLICMDCKHCGVQLPKNTIKSPFWHITNPDRITWLETTTPCMRTYRETKRETDMVCGIVSVTGTARECRACREDESDCGYSARFFEREPVFEIVKDTRSVWQRFMDWIGWS